MGLDPSSRVANGHSPQKQRDRWEAHALYGHEAQDLYAASRGRSLGHTSDSKAFVSYQS